MDDRRLDYFYGVFKDYIGRDHALNRLIAALSGLALNFTGRPWIVFHKRPLGDMT